MNRFLFSIPFFIIAIKTIFTPSFIHAATPIGIFDSVNTTNWTLNGWAYDANSPTVSINVRVIVDGASGTGWILGDFTTNIKRNDVNTAKNITGNHGFSISIPEYLHGQYHVFYIYGIDSTDKSLTLLSSSPKNSLTKPNANLLIKGIVDGSIMTISTSERMAGAIDSLIWKDKQFINAFDHGRELQSASSFDGLGECYNPTEAGSGANSQGQTSSSVLNYSKQTPNSLTTIISPAFWTKPNPISCKNSGVPTRYTTAFSNYLIRKDVTIGSYNIPNIIEYKTSYYVPETHSAATFENVTGYMTNDFTSYWSYNPKTEVLQKLENSPAGGRGIDRSGTVIFSTPDKKYAMGIYCPPPVAYARFDFSGNPDSGTNKWNCAYYEKNLTIGTYNYVGYIAVGSFDTVRASMKKIYTKLNSASILGDANHDGIVDLTDFGIWKYEFLVDTGSMRSNFNKNDTIDLDDFQIWKREYLK